MPWIAITIDTLKEAKVAALIEACDSAALGDAQPNRAAGIIQGVVNSVRNAISGCKSRTIDTDTTKIPEALRDLCVGLMIPALKDTINQALTDYEKSTLDWARRELEKIRKCDYPIENPGTAIEPPVQGNTNPGSWGSATKIKMRTDPS